MPRLRRADCAAPGIARRRRGKGFEYLTEDGRRVTEPSVIERIQELAIPPAWNEVWVCPYPNGHIQATGVDAAGRKQYRYHDYWRERRDREKFETMRDFARALPALRERVARDLNLEGMPRERALACAVRLLDRGFFRIGSESYAEENETYGVATILKRHVTVVGDEVTFDYEAKGGKQRVQTVVDPQVAEIAQLLKRRRGGKEELLAYKLDGRWVDVKSMDINAYVKDVADDDFSAKDFRTWSGTVIAAVVLAAAGEAGRGSQTARTRAKNRAVQVVSKFLGNTPAVARASYIDPRVFDRFDGGRTIGGLLTDLVEDEHASLEAQQRRYEEAVVDLLEDGSAWPEAQPSFEAAVLELLEGDWSSDAIVKVA
ncbi:MAG TPA: hypothetical protein VEQ61_09560 [Thermoleophilaceae bacterium]|nr:hypothetical protein [Thermoleophilaceae bacterium]